MITSKTPFRVTLGGGGSDLPSFYERHGGFVFSMGIDKYMYVSLNSTKVDSHIRVQYTKSEKVRHPDELHHELAREALKRYEIFSRLEVSSLADLPSGTGLGSSSCYVVGLLNALRTYRKQSCDKLQLAEEACEIELDILSKGIGKQDQYMASFGGMTVLDIEKTGKVAVRSARISRSTLADFVANTQLYYTGVSRSAPLILQDQDHAMRSDDARDHAAVERCLLGIKEVGHGILDAVESENYDEFGRLLDVHWQHKKGMSAKIAIPGLDQLYAEMKSRFGVLGAKVSGAGGGGFFLVYAPKEHDALEKLMLTAGMHRMHYAVEFEGTKIVCDTDGETADVKHDAVSGGAF